MIFSLEKKSWEQGSPQSLQNTMWLNNIIHVGLRGCTERNLRCSDVVLETDSCNVLSTYYPLATVYSPRMLKKNKSVLRTAMICLTLCFGDEKWTFLHGNRRCKVFGGNAVCVVAYSMTSTNASGLFGRVGEFNAEHKTFKAYVQRIEMFFTANNIVETMGEGSTQTNRVVADRKRAIFLTEVGPEVYSTLSNLLAPANSKDTSFTDIVHLLEKHYNPKPLEIAQSFHFGTRNQKSGESISDYVLALRRLAVHCNYGEFLDRALRDRFVCALNNSKIQNKLLNAEDLTFAKGCSIAKTMEKLEKNTQEFYPTSSESNQVNKLTEQSS